MRCFVIGGGSSFKPSEDTIKKLNKEVTFCATKSYKVIKPSYFFSLDLNDWKENFNEYLKLNCPVYCTDRVYNNIKELKYSKVNVLKNTNRDIIPKSIKKPINIGNNSGLGCIKIAYLLNYEPIYLVGLDFCFSVKDNKKVYHWHSEYEKMSKIDKRLDAFYSSTCQFIEKADIEIISCSPISRLNNIIKYKSLKEVLI